MARTVVDEAIVKFDADIVSYLQKTKQVSKQNRDNAAAARESARQHKQMQEDLRGVARNAALMFGPLDGVAGRITTLSVLVGEFGPRMLLATAGVTASVIAMATAIRGAFTEYSKFEVGIASTQALLDAQNNSLGISALQLDELARAVARNTLASVDGARQGATVLQSFGTLSNDVFRRALVVSQSLAQIMQKDLPTAARVFGRALSDPVDSLDALQRYTGEAFVEELKAQNAEILRQEGFLAAQINLLTRVEEKWGDIGEAVADGTLAGNSDTFGQEITDLYLNLARLGEDISKEQPGLLARAFDGLQELVIAPIQFLNRQFEPELQKTIEIQRQKLGELNNELARLTAPRSDRETFIDWFFPFLSDEADAGTDQRIAEVRQQIQNVRQFLDSQNVAAFGTEAENERDRKQREEQEKESAAHYLKLNAQLGDYLTRRKAQLQIAFAQRGEEIDKLSLTDEQVQAEEIQGITTLGQLKAKLHADNLARLNEEVTATEQSVSGRISAEQRFAEALARLEGSVSGDPFARINERERRELKALDDLNLKKRQMEEKHEQLTKAIRAKFRSQKVDLIAKEDEKEERQKLALRGRLLDMEIQFSQNDEQRLANERQKALDDLDQLYNDKLAKDQRYYDLKAAIQRRYDEEEQRLQNSRAGAFGQALDNLVGFEQKTNQERLSSTIAFGKQTFAVLGQQSKKAFIAFKAFQVAEAVVQGYNSAIAAYSWGAKFGGPPLGAVMAGLSVAFTAAQINAIRSQQAPSQFHAGIDYVPKDLDNVSLVQGEAVLDRFLNADLREFLKDQSRGRGQAGMVNQENHFHVDDSVDKVQRFMHENANSVGRQLSRAAGRP